MRFLSQRIKKREGLDNFKVRLFAVHTSFVTHILPVPVTTTTTTTTTTTICAILMLDVLNILIKTAIQAQ